MTDVKLLNKTIPESNPTISVKLQLLGSLTDDEYRKVFVQERVRSFVALQIRSLRDQRKMTQQQLGDAIGMAQTWVSKLENPDYGKMTISTLLRLANAFDTDLEIKFQPFSKTIHDLPTQGPDYFRVPSFKEEVEAGVLSQEHLLIEEREDALVASLSTADESSFVTVEKITNVPTGWEPFEMSNVRSHELVVYAEATRILPREFMKSALSPASITEQRAA